MSSSSSLPAQPIEQLPAEERKLLHVATFAAGCFWSVELVLQREPGVYLTEVGYTGGAVTSPTYHQVCSGSTGHAEAVQLRFDPSETSYERLLDVFWRKHDPTTRNRQGNDVGTQYRSAIFYHTDEQRVLAEESKRKEQAKPEYKTREIVTEIVPAATWYAAEAYHQRYLEKGGQCALKGSKIPIRCYG